MSGLLTFVVLAVVLGAADGPALEIPKEVTAQNAVTLRFTRTATVPAAGIEVAAIYRENAHARLRSEQKLGQTGPDGTLSWTPEAAGVVVLQWEGGKKNVSVLHPNVPPTGVIVAIIAGFLLLGGTIRYFLQMLREGGDDG